MRMEIVCFSCSTSIFFVNLGWMQNHWQKRTCFQQAMRVVISKNRNQQLSFDAVNIGNYWVKKKRKKNRCVKSFLCVPSTYNTRSRDKRLHLRVNFSCFSFGQHMNRRLLRPFQFATCILYLPTSIFFHLYNPLMHHINHREPPPKLPPEPPSSPALPRQNLMVIPPKPPKLRVASCGFIPLVSLVKYVVESSRLAKTFFLIIFPSGRLCTGVWSERCSRQSLGCRVAI